MTYGSSVSRKQKHSGASEQCNQGGQIHYKLSQSLTAKLIPSGQTAKWLGRSKYNSKRVKSNEGISIEQATDGTSTRYITKPRVEEKANVLAIQTSSSKMTTQTDTTVHIEAVDALAKTMPKMRGK
ncbi:unnamed protein product [Ceratitis capitata]|uniref:(Mediterranean fruit fly) hypothetical protein n=1 Tax=Ceratitis capitata TaxID=7213 RepID=A0A811UB39_CERCA|nr:unnamed protein product [Ceratitis capitata]